MQETSMPNCSSTNSLHLLSNSDDLCDIAKHLWNALLAHLQARKPNCKKGPKSWCLELTKEDILEVRHCSRKEFWRKAQQCHKRGKLTMVGKSGSMLFWTALNSLMVGEQPRVIIEDNQILGRPNSHGARHLATHACIQPVMTHTCPTIVHVGRPLHAFDSTYV